MTAAGGAVVVPDPSPYPDPGHWARLMDAADVTFVLAVARAAGDARRAPGERWRAGPDRAAAYGDPGRRRAARHASRPAACPESACAGVQRGGPAESCVLSVMHAVGRVDPAATSIPLGRPMANQRYHVLDERLQPVPRLGAGGDPHRLRGGPGPGVLAGRGADRRALPCRARPRRTRLRLRGHGPVPAERRPGDPGAQGLPGEDPGVRIELGGDRGGAGRTPRRGLGRGRRRPHRARPSPCCGPSSWPRGRRPVVPDELRLFLARKLPSAMLPADITRLERMPLNANGKIDRLALTGGPGRERVRVREQRRQQGQVAVEEALARSPGRTGPRRRPGRRVWCRPGRRRPA
ncbi:hypothetical protein LT493_16345 [Streptomyces tricolor]|nr:hypothetical protein [Streptomyces tricolor]